MESKQKNVRIGIMGLGNVTLIKNILEEQYVVYDLQSIWDSNEESSMKEKKYREIIEECDILMNLYTGLFFWAKSSYAKLKGKKIITYWMGEDVNKVIRGENGYLGHQEIHRHLARTEEIASMLNQVKIDNAVLELPEEFDSSKRKQWLLQINDVIEGVLNDK